MRKYGPGHIVIDSITTNKINHHKRAFNEKIDFKFIILKYYCGLRPL